MTVFCVNSGTTYADITAADAAESGIDYGTPTIFEQSGASTSAVVFSNADYPSSFIYRAASGQETDGTTSTGAQCTGQITSSVSNHEFLNLRTGRISINFSTAGGANLENLVINGTGGDPILFPTSPTAQTMTNVIVYNCSDAWRATSTNDNVIATNCTAVDCTGFGFLRPRCVDTVALNTGSAAYLQIGASSSNYWADDGTGSNAITESPTTDIFVDYANGDYRILASSSVGAAGAGAFIQSAGTVITVTESLVNYQYSVNNPSIELTGIIEVTESTANYQYSTNNPQIILTSTLTVTEAQANYQFTSNNPTIELTNTIIEVIEQKVSYSYLSNNPTILLTPEPIGVVSVVCFPGCLKELNFNGTNIDLSYNGTDNQARFDGDLKELEFNGTIKLNCTDGNIKTNC